MVEIAAMAKNKKEAAEYLGISTRMLENYATKGRLSVRKERGATGDIAIYDDKELRQLRAELDAKRAPRPSIVRESGEASAMVRASGSDVSGLVPGGFFVQLVAALASNKAPILQLGDKLTLTLAEAAALAGLSKDFLSKAIHAKKLKAAKRGRGWNIKKDDLEDYVRKL